MTKGKNPRPKRQRVVLSDDSSNEAPGSNTTQDRGKRSRIVHVDDSEDEQGPSTATKSTSRTPIVISSGEEEDAPVRPKPNTVRSVGPADKPMKVLKMFDDTKLKKWRKPRSKAQATTRPSSTSGGSFAPHSSSTAAVPAPSPAATSNAPTAKPSAARPSTSNASPGAGPSSSESSSSVRRTTIKAKDDTKSRPRFEVQVLKPIFKEEDQGTLEYWLDMMGDEPEDEDETEDVVKNVDWRDFENALKEEHIDMVELPPFDPGDDIKGKLLSAITKALEVVAGRDLDRRFARELGTAEGGEIWAERVAAGISKGVTDLVTRGDRRMPRTDEFISKLRSTHDLPYWGAYIKLGIPLKPGLPILIYVGSGTAIAAGLKSRHGSHISMMRNDAVDDVFQKAWRPNTGDYQVVILEGFSLPGFDHRAATDEELRSAYALTLCAELVLAELFNCHDKFGSAELAFDLDARHKPCNRAEPLATPPKLEFPQRAFPCTWEGCNAVRRSPSELARHLRYHSGERLHECPLCNKCFYEASTVREHMRAVHEGVHAFECDECPKLFKWPSSLRTHKSTEHGIRRRFACSRCTDVFTSKFGRDEHERFVHDGDVRECRYKCEECTYGTHTKPQLAIHIAREHKNQELPKHFKCKTCDAAFHTQHRLVAHMPSHAPPGFTCAICNEPFTYNGDLQRHQGTHEVKPTSVYCPICNAPFSHKGRLTKHVNKVHPGEGSNQYPCRKPGAGCISSYASPESRDTHERKCWRH